MVNVCLCEQLCCTQKLLLRMGPSRNLLPAGKMYSSPGEVVLFLFLYALEININY